MGCCCCKRHDDKPDGSQSEKTAVRTPVKQTTYEALWDYKAGSNSEVNLTKGEVLQGEPDTTMGPEWVLVSKAGKGTGYVPQSWLAEVGTVEAEPWYFPEMRRDQADKILSGMADGTYIIRGKHGKDGVVSYAVSVAFNGGARHYRVKKWTEKDGSTRFVLAKMKFVSIYEMVAYFQQHEGNICAKLETPAPKREPDRIVVPADVQKNWREIPRKQVELVGAVLGKGNFGFVRKGIWRPTATIALEVAVKELKPGMTKNARKEFLSEALVMKNLVHERLVKLHGIVSADEPYWIITEFVKNGALKDYLRKRAKESDWLPEPKLIEMASQIADGMRYMEGKHVVHRDLAARNVLVDEQPGESIKETKIDLKIADFGMATVAQTNKFKEGKIMDVPIKWTAPEVLTGLRYSSASDVWSYGILLYELFTHGEEPYKGKTPKQVRDETLKERRFTMERPEGMSEGLFDVITNCCQFNHRNRPPFQEVYETVENLNRKGVDPYDRYRQ